MPVSPRCHPMTAEIVIMNRMGVALAADSAVTIGTAASKIYTSAEKVFQLSLAAPVGVMVYGNAGYVALPWETIVKEFRRQLGKTVYPTVVDYRRAFVDFLRDHPELFPSDSRLYVASVLTAEIFEDVDDKRRELLREARLSKLQAGTGPLTKADTAAVLGDAIAAVTAEVEMMPEVDGLTRDIRDAIKGQVAAGLDKSIEQAFPESVEVSDEAKAKLSDLAVSYLTRQSLRDLASGVVIAGFGEKEFMPALATFEVEECAGVLPRIGRTREIAITATEQSYVLPFAQQESVLQFLFGVDAEVAEFMEGSASRMTSGLIDLVLDKVAEANADLANGLRDPVKAIVAQRLEDLFESWNEQQRGFFRPILPVISVLPKDELAAMAESFVNLTKFRRRVTPVPETVSGPIDVAVITKGDGFVWTRRKHYFDPEINPRVMARFHHSGEGQ